MNMALCIFDQSWSLDSDYLRCRACRSRQLTNYANEPFEHAPGCELADVLPARPWLELLRILAPMLACPVAAAPADTWFADQLTAMGEVIPLASAPAAPGIDLEQFRERIKAAIVRITTGQALMRVPADQTDPDIVLADILSLIDTSPKGSCDAREHFQDRLAEIEGRPRPEPEVDEVEEVIASLGDDAAAMLDKNPEDERALNMQRAADLLAELQPTSHGAGVSE
ncbi:hypothetical protein ARC78_15595 [Stenotrophomonas pictorum JCM 9942]|uniref:Uncharacterized protein n=2 Tax=Stenotrophomonas pictorum TaxID=86184 RepID=A0A0R0A015_9GAMM|nr:hypothetical protein ARC78_15595 [Stenotrophomonas pictorum JCM 9942]